MLDVFNTATPTKGNVQYFYKSSSWTKPRGVSHVYMMLIGGGGNGDGGSVGGGPGVVTTWYGAAQHVPDDLVITVSTGQGVTTSVNYRATNGLNVLLSAASGAVGGFGTAMTANAFTALGIFKSNDGNPSGTPSFLSDINTSTYYYGYQSATNGYFLTQPIVVGVGPNVGTSGKGGIGTGAGYLSTSGGGPGLVIIAAW